ncbi:MAG TPA: hypothetical protein VFW98_16925 [Gemmatimonadaceae bacterium]|nr:hypothetical protein [Gemmatimonadaceae bacterium]
MHTTKRKRAHVAREDENAMITVGPNDNIFTALNLPDADDWLAKAELAHAMGWPIREREPTPT